MAKTCWMTSAEVGTSAGASVAEHVRERSLHSRAYRDALVRLAPLEALARRVILCRARFGLTRHEMAGRLGTTALVVARIERGQDEITWELRRRLMQVLAAC